MHEPFNIECGHRWYALTVKPRHDKSVANHLQSKGYETFLPTYKRRHNYGKRSKETELPLFPGYVFCHLDVHARLPVLVTPGVIQILGNGRTPIPVDANEIDSLRSAYYAKAPLKPHPYFDAGQKVRVAEGSLAGVEGTVVQCKEGLRVVLSVTLLQRSVLLEIDSALLKLEAPAAKRCVA